MPIITDRRLATLYAAFETQKRSNPSLKLGTEQALQILAEVGDRSGWSASKALTELKKPGMTQAQQIAFAQKGLSAGEKKDLAQILDAGTVPLEASAKQFLEAVLGRTSPGGNTTLEGWSLDISAVPEPVNVALGVFAPLLIGFKFFQPRAASDKLCADVRVGTAGQ